MLHSPEKLSPLLSSALFHLKVILSSPAEICYVRSSCKRKKTVRCHSAVYPCYLLFTWVTFTVNRKKTSNGDFTTSHISLFVQDTHKTEVSQPECIYFKNILSMLLLKSPPNSQVISDCNDIPYI